MPSVEVMSRFGKALADLAGAAVPLQLQQDPPVPSELTTRIEVSRRILSSHLACLRACELMVGQPAGRNVRYELSDAKLGHALQDMLGTILTVEPVCRRGRLEDATNGAGSEKVVA